MTHQLFSTLSMEQLKAEISEAVIKEIAPYLKDINKPSQPCELITRRDAAKLLGISLPTLLDWTNTGKIIGYRIASRVRYKRAELENSLSKIKTRA